jgi:hypothetical protein
MSRLQRVSCDPVKLCNSGAVQGGRIPDPCSVAAQREHLANAITHLDLITAAIGSPWRRRRGTTSVLMSRGTSVLDAAEGTLQQIAENAGAISEQEASPEWCGLMCGLLAVWQGQVATIVC